MLILIILCSFCIYNSASHDAWQAAWHAQEGLEAAKRCEQQMAAMQRKMKLNSLKQNALNHLQSWAIKSKDESLDRKKRDDYYNAGHIFIVCVNNGDSYPSNWKSKEYEEALWILRQAGLDNINQDMKEACRGINYEVSFT